MWYNCSHGIDFMQSFGLDVEMVDKGQLSAKVKQYEQEYSMTVMHPFDDPRLIEGYGR